MTDRELENLLREPDTLHELERAVGDPSLWLGEDAGLSEQDRLARKQELQHQIREAAFARLNEQPRRGERTPLPRRALRYFAAAAAIVLLLLAGVFALLPQGKAMAAALGELISRKVTGHVVVESAGSPPPGVVQSSGMRISGVDGFEMNAYQSLDEYIQKTGLHPVVLTGGYRTLEQITDETDPEAGSYTLMIVYTTPDGGYITTNQVWKKNATPYIVPNSFERQALGLTFYCNVSEDSMFTSGSALLAEDCVFHLTAPYEMNYDALLPQLAYSETVDTRAYTIVLPTPDPNQPQQEKHSYRTPEEFMQDTGYSVAALDGFGLPENVDYFPSDYAPQTVYVIYNMDGHRVYIYLQWGNVDGMVMSMEDSTYFETTVLGDYTMRASVDKKDGSAAGIATLDHAVLSVFAEKGVDFQDVLSHLVLLKPENR